MQEEDEATAAQRKLLLKMKLKSLMDQFVIMDEYSFHMVISAYAEVAVETSVCRHGLPETKILIADMSKAAKCWAQQYDC